MSESLVRVLMKSEMRSSPVYNGVGGVKTFFILFHNFFPLPVRCDEKGTADSIQETLATVAKLRAARNSAIQAARVVHAPTV